MSEKVSVEVDRDILEDLQMKILNLKSQTITLMNLIDDIPSDDNKKLDYQDKELARNLAAVLRDFSQYMADTINACIANGGGIKKVGEECNGPNYTENA